MVYLYFCISFCILQCCRSMQSLNGWDYINLHCRDNDNKPVDWWYIYKPPSAYEPYMERGRNFSYITPDSGGRWQGSEKHITDRSMLQHTLSPMFRSTYVDNLAYVTYEENAPQSSFLGSKALGILMADEMGGLWIGHTVKGFPDLSYDRVTFPDGETDSGHLLVCISIDLLTLNEIGNTLRNARPNYTMVHVPKLLETLLPDWSSMERPVSRSEPVQSRSLDFLSKYKSVHASVLTRAPGARHCLYAEFARNRGLVLDAYAPSDKEAIATCNLNYGVRSISSISLKLKESVHYVLPNVDRARFAVSTAAPWQKAGAGPAQHWVCTSNLGLGDRSGKGGVLLCVDSYDIWLAFDNLKVKEPEC